MSFDAADVTATKRFADQEQVLVPGSNRGTNQTHGSPRTTTVGDKFPPEADYAAELGVSRSTLRLAFADLEASGVLKRRKRAGTVIISDAPRQRFNMATTGINELLSLGRDTQRFQVRTDVQID